MTATETRPTAEPAIAERLRSRLAGPVLAPGDPDYDTTRLVFAGGIERRPAAIARVAGARDVAEAVTVARETGVELAVRSGGHSVAGHSTTDGGVVIDLRALSALEIDPERRTAWAGAGATAAAYTAAAGAHGLATGLGDVGTVGLGGLTLGGGVGYLVRKHGLTIDSLLAAEVVTADGVIRHVDADHHPDLFWAIRGGGGNFGVASRLCFRLHPVGEVVGGMLMLPATAEVIAGLIAVAEAAPEELSVIANVGTLPPLPFVPEAYHGRVAVMALVCYAGDLDAGERAVARLRALAEPILDGVQRMRYAEIYPPEDPDYRPRTVSDTLFVDHVDREVAATILGHLEASDAPLRVVQLRVLGGAVARVPADATAYAHRASRIMVNVGAFYEGPGDRPATAAWVSGVVAALRQGDDRAYVNFLGDDADRLRAAYPAATWRRLTEVKARYDPTNLFRRNHNVPPAG